MSKTKDDVLFKGQPARVVGRVYGSFDIEERYIVLCDGHFVFADKRSLTPVAPDSARQTVARDA